MNYTCTDEAHVQYSKTNKKNSASMNLYRKLYSKEYKKLYEFQYRSKFCVLVFDYNVEQGSPQSVSKTSMTQRQYVW